MTITSKPQSVNSWLNTQQWFSIQELRLFVFGMGLSILAKGMSAFTLAYAMDDILWINFPFESSLLREVALGDMRFLYPVIVEFLYQLGLDVPKAYTLSAFCMMASQVLSAQLVCRIWRVEKDWLVSLIIIALVTLHPYQADIFTWRISLFIGGMPFVLVMLGLWFAVFLPRNGLGFGVLTIIASLAIYQVPITFAAVVVCFSVVLAALQSSKPLGEAWVDRKITQQILVLGFGMICYLIVASLVRLIWPPTAAFDRAKILNNLDSIALSDNVFDLLELLFFRNPLFTPLADCGLVLLAGIFVVAVIIRIDKCQSRTTPKLLTVALIAVMLLIAWFACTGLAILSQKGPISPRLMLPFSLMWAGVVTVSLSVVQNKICRRVIFGIISLLSLAFVATNNQVLSDQLRANQRDIEFANRIVNNIEQLDGFRHIVNVAVIGTTNQSLSGLRTGLDLSKPGQQPKLGIVTSIFANTYGDEFRTLLLNEVTGSRFGPTLSKEEKKTAESYCKYARNYLAIFYPMKGSIIRDKGLGVVCL